MQGQENRKANILGLETSLSNDAAELLLDEDTQMVGYHGRIANDFTAQAKECLFL